MKTKDLISVVESQSDIINFTNSLLTDFHIFHKENLSVLETQVIQGTKFFNKLFYLLERDIILNFSYLFSESENDFFRLPKTLHLIAQKHKKLSWIASVSLETIIRHSEKVDAIIESSEIKTVRDKAIAHKEMNWQQKIPIVNISYLDELNSLCAQINDDIFRNLSNKVMESTWDKYQLMNFELVLKNLVAYHELEEKYYGGTNYGR